MVDYKKEMPRNGVFAEINEADIEKMLKCVQARRKSFESGSYIMHEGDAAGTVGIIISGEISIVFDDFWGNRALVGKLHPGEMVGDAYTYTPDKMLHINVIASVPTTVFMIDYEKFITPCANACASHTRLMKNLLGLFANKLIAMMRKMTFVSKRSLREKIMTFLSAQASLSGSNTITVDMSRQEFADYLYVDRSALSRELSSMQSDGIIEFYKNSFRLIK